MKKIAILAAIVLTGASLLGQGGLRYSIQVSKFENQAGWGHWDLGDAWGAVLTDKLQQSGKFIVIAESDLRQDAMEEQDFGASGRTAGGSKTPQTGQMTPAQLLVKGAITQFDDGTSGGDAGVGFKGIRVGVKKGTALISGTVYVVDSTTGTVTTSKNFEATITKKGLSLGVNRHGFDGDIGGFKKTPAGQVMNDAVVDVVAFLESQLDSIKWSATIIRGGETDIIINRGSREGVSEGQIFQVGESEEIRDPDTGELLDTDFTISGKIQVTRVKEKLAYCKLIEGKAPKKGASVSQ